MHILMYRWKAYNYRDIEQTFRLLGHTVDNLSLIHISEPTRRS